MIREDADIKGIHISNKEHKISQFADDAQLMNIGDRISFEKTIQLISKFGEFSGLFLNENKTQTNKTQNQHQKQSYSQNQYFITRISKSRIAQLNTKIGSRGEFIVLHIFF